LDLSDRGEYGVNSTTFGTSSEEFGLVFPGRLLLPCDKRSDFWNMESSLASAFQNSINPKFAGLDGEQTTYNHNNPHYPTYPLDDPPFFIIMEASKFRAKAVHGNALLS
jgi:hypothetical protein